MKELILVSSAETAEQDQRLLAFAASMGVLAKVVSIRDGGLRRVLDQFQPKTDCLAMSAETLAAVHKVSILAISLQKLIDEYFVALLIFGCNASAEQSS